MHDSFSLTLERAQSKTRVPAVGEGLNANREQQRELTIKEYWAERGFRVRARIEAVAISPSFTLPCLRSDLVGGLPPGARS